MITGELSLRLINNQGRMVFEKSYVRGALKLGKPVWRNGVPLYYLLHVGGGYVSGDQYSQQIELLDHTSLYLTTQAATKVYKGQNPAIVSTNIKIGEGSHLSFLQDPLIMYENATFHQFTEIELAPTSTLYFSEIITPGWSASANPFLYNELYSDFSIKRDGKLFYVDRLCWGGGIQPTMLQLDSYSHYGTYLCIESSLPSSFIDQLYQIEKVDCQIGLSKLKEEGFVLKIIANQTQTIEAIFQEVDTLLRNRKGEKPLLLRKY
jgi:urease accessory protein